MTTEKKLHDIIDALVDYILGEVNSPDPSDMAGITQAFNHIDEALCTILALKKLEDIFE